MSSELKIDFPMTLEKSSLRWALALFAAVAVIIGASIIYVLSEPELDYTYRFASALTLVKGLYPEDYDDSRAVRQAREAVLAELDRFSGYMEKDELERALEEFGGSYGGVGITVVGHDMGLQIMSVREDGPAGRAGLKTGDIIIKASDVCMAGMNPLAATKYLRGKEGTSVNISVIRAVQNDTLSITLVRETLKLIHIPYAGITPGNSIYVRILDFESGAAEELLAALDSLYVGREDSARGIILDLRGNPGGLLSEAVAVSDLFLDKDILIVGVRGRSRWNRAEFRSEDGDAVNNLPLAVIVDRGSASASEIFAGTIKYSGRGVLIGDTTFGKGLVQELDRMFDGSGLRLTVARYYFEGNIYLNDPEASDPDVAAGIPPDYYIKFSDDEPFPLRLESSSLIRNFALARQEEIAQDSISAAIPSDWFDDFVSYAAQNRFMYESGLTAEIQNAMDEAVFEKRSEETIEAIKRLHDLSLQEDSAAIMKYRNYIVQRIYQTALEARYGSATAYRNAIIPYRPDIALAESLFATDGK
jgi:carboxyl-terminal processing protease